LDDRLRLAFQLALAREPLEDELEGLANLYQAQHKYFDENPLDAEKFGIKLCRNSITK